MFALCSARRSACQPGPAWIPPSAMRSDRKLKDEGQLQRLTAARCGTTLSGHRVTAPFDPNVGRDGNSHLARIGCVCESPDGYRGIILVDYI